MQILKLTASGTSVPEARVLKGARGHYFCLVHGEEGRGRWQIRIPLLAREFPVPEGASTYDRLPLEGEYKLVPTGKKDARGNENYVLGRGAKDDKQLVLWWLSPGFRGGATWAVHGAAQVVALGEEAQGDAGRMGGADCPVLLVTGPCRLEWRRSGRLYGEPASWLAEFDGSTWAVGPKRDADLEEAAFE